MKPRSRLLVGGWHLLKQLMAFDNPSAGGCSTMAEALREVAELNRELRDKCGTELCVSAHLCHQLAIPATDSLISSMAQYNSPASIDFNYWTNGVEMGKFAPIGRIIPPGFGFPGSDLGAFIHPDPARRRLAHEMMVYAFSLSTAVKNFKWGLGDVIYWTGPDGLRWQRLVEGDDVRLGYELNPQLEEWQLVVNGVGQAVKDALAQGYEGSKLLFEGKAAGDPCYLDVFTDPYLEARGIKEINEIVGAPITVWQGEFCHSRGGGTQFFKAMRTAIKEGVFGGQIHFNSGGLASQDFSELLKVHDGTPASCFQQYVDNDFLPGEGPAEWMEDQCQSLAEGVKWSAQTGNVFEVEFDARFCRYENMIEKLKQSTLWTINQLQMLGAEMC